MFEDQIGCFFDRIELVTCRDSNVSRPRVRAINKFSLDIRVEFPRHLRELFPLGTRYMATVKVCQKTQNYKPKGSPYLRAYDIALIADSVPDEGLVAQVCKGSISELAYEYIWKTKS